ncbi:uncharacterized protein TNCT_572431 [Trichonephila clavata]|uniref:Uncharacterized protein n=1 Tax=Trichonephila clavata TaxID=2740835 RepID=A0A8X6GNB8_TRICU|nr:uncharacterized protein TNCT_572431 [Trichonephila clavata]
MASSTQKSDFPASLILKAGSLRYSTSNKLDSLAYKQPKVRSRAYSSYKSFFPSLWVRPNPILIDLPSELLGHIQLNRIHTPATFGDFSFPISRC